MGKLFCYCCRHKLHDMAADVGDELLPVCVGVRCEVCVGGDDEDGKGVCCFLMPDTCLSLLSPLPGRADYV